MDQLLLTKEVKIFETEEDIDADTTKFNGCCCGLYDALIDAGRQVMKNNLLDENVSSVEKNAHCEQSADLQDKDEQSKQILQDFLQVFQFSADSDKAESWMNEKEMIVGNTDYGENKDSSESLLKKHETLMGELIDFKNIVNELEKRAATFLINNSEILNRQKHISDQYDRLLFLAENRQTKLIEDVKAEALKRKVDEQKVILDSQTDLITIDVRSTTITQFNIEFFIPKQTDVVSRLYGFEQAFATFGRFVDGIKDWIKEKNEILNNDYLGNDLRSVRALQSKHNDVERALIALGNKIRQLDEIADRLVEVYPEAAQKTLIKQQAINELCTQLIAKADSRKEKLLDSFELQWFLNEHRDFLVWINSMSDLLSSKELINSITEADILIQRLQEQRTEIDLRADNFQALEQFGENLLNSNHYASREIRDKLEELDQAHTELKRDLINRRNQLYRNLDLNLFYRDCNRAENWISGQEAILESDETISNGDLEIFIKKYEGMKKIINKRYERKIIALKNISKQLIADQHFASELIDVKFKQVLGRWRHLENAVAEKLDQIVTLKKFDLDADVIENWIAEKLQEIPKENWDTLDNIRSKQWKLEVFQEELAANADRLKSVVADGTEMIEKIKSEEVRKRLDLIVSQWELLTEKIVEHSKKLEVVTKLKSGIAATILDLDSWLEKVLMSVRDERVGIDLDSVQNSIEEHGLIQADITAHKDILEELNFQVDLFIAIVKVNTKLTQEKRQSVNQRFERVEILAAFRKTGLVRTLALYEFYENVAKEESWITGRKLLAASDDYGVDVKGVQRLIEKHQRLETEISSHATVIQVLEQTGEKLTNISGLVLFDVLRRLEILDQAWTELVKAVQFRNQKLQQSLTYQKFCSKIEQEEACIAERIKLARSLDTGETVSENDWLLKQHDNLAIRYKINNERFFELCYWARKVASKDIHYADKINQRCQKVRVKLDVLIELEEKRRAMLLEKSAYLRFMQQAQDTKRRIAAKETQFDCYKYEQSNFFSLETMLARQEAFDAGVAALGLDSIESFTHRKDELIASNHTQSSAILQVYTNVFGRWQDLLDISLERKQYFIGLLQRQKIGSEKKVKLTMQ